MNEIHIPSFRLARKRDRLNIDLQDTNDLGLPVNMTPVWPETDTQNIARLIDNAKKEVSKKINGNEGKFLYSQLNALDYLYGQRDEALNDTSKHNPLVDIIALIANVGDGRSSHSTLQLAVEGAPESIPFITRTPLTKKPEQRTFEVKSWGKKEYRTIARFSSQLSTVLKGLDILNEASKHHPLIIRSAIHEYSDDYGGGTSFTTGTAMGIIEILNNLDLLGDSRFNSLATELREVVLEDVINYSELKKRYSYRVVEKRPFWYQGEVNSYRRKRMNYVVTDGETRIEVNKFPKLFLPAITGWQRKSRERTKIIKKHRELTLFNSLKKSAINFSEEIAIRTITEDRLKKAVLREQRLSLESKQYGKLRRVWRNFIELEIDEGSNITENEEELIQGAISLILEQFITDPALSQKARTNILGRKSENDKVVYYHMDAKELANDLIFSWVLSLRNPYIAKGFKKALEGGDEAVESFYLLTKLMAFDVLKKSLGTKEYKLLFDPNYKHKFNKESMLTLFEKIKELGDIYTPDINDIVTQAIRENHVNIKDLLTESSMKKMREKLEDLTYEKILVGIVKDKAIALTGADKLRAKYMAKWMAITFGVAVLLSVGREGVIEISGLIDDRKEEKYEEEYAEAIAAAELGYKEEAEKQAEMERLQRIQAQVVARVDQTESQVRQESIAANMARIPGEMTDRIPDAIRFDGEDNSPRSNSERYGITGFGKIYHLPENMPLRNGDPVGYFPWDINLTNAWGVNYDTLSRHRNTKYLEPFEQTFFVDSIDSSNLEISSNQLAYSLNGVNAEVYPPIGWKIVKVYQEGGKQPMIGPLGELYYAHDNYENFPTRTLLVLEETPREFIDPKISILTEVAVRDYWPRFRTRDAEVLNYDLQGDEVLQQIHGDFIDEMGAVYDKYLYFYDSEDIKEAKKEWSDIAIKYAKLYANYTVQERYYALDFQVDKTRDGRYLTLKSLADQPDNGYFCSVASFAFRDFMRSVGIVTGNQPGITLFNHQGYMWGGLGHQNNIVFLPDGRVLEVDMTPYVTNRTSQEDLDWLAGRMVTEEEIKKEIEDMTNNMNAINTPESAPIPATEEEQLEQIVQDREIIKFIQNNKDYISDSELNMVLNNISESARGMISERLRETGATNTTLDGNNIESNRFEMILLNRISVNVQRIQDSYVNMKSIYLNKATGEQILEEYDLTKQIIRDAETLKTLLKSNAEEIGSDTEIAALDKIISDTKEIQKALNHFGGERLEEAREDSLLISELEREYRKLRALEGKNAKIEFEYDSLYKPEVVVAKRFREENREIHDNELEFFTHTVDEHAWDANDFIDTAYEVPIPDTIEHDDPMYINGYSWRQITDPVKASHLISNTPDVYDKLDKESRIILKNLTETYRQMSEIFRGDHQDFDGEIEKIKIFSDDLKYLHGSLTTIIENKNMRASFDENEYKRFQAYTQGYAEEQNKQDDEDQVINVEEKNIDLDFAKIGNIAQKLGVGSIPLAIGYLGIRSFNKRKSKKEILKRIEESFNVGGNLTQIEKNLALSVVGHITHLKYDEAFPEKVAHLLNLLQQYSAPDHENAIRWLTNEGAVTLCEDSPAKTFMQLAELFNGKSKNGSANEIKKHFPATVVEELDILSKKNGGNGSNVNIEIPHDFNVICGMSLILSNDSLIKLQKDVRKRLELESKSGKISVSYKVDDVLDLLRSKYASSHTPKKTKSLFNSILFLLQWASLSTEEPILSD